MKFNLSCYRQTVGFFALSCLLATPMLTETTSAAVTSKPFGSLADGSPVTLYTLTNKKGMSVDVMNYGATVVRILAPDQKGSLADVVLGFDSLDGYLGKEPYFGATIGRCANRIAGGTFSLDGKDYKLALSDTPRPNSLHGGFKGFDKQMWKGKILADENAVSLSLVSPDGQEGYPGTVNAKVVFKLTEKGELHISLSATTDQPTLVNLTNHSYFNLGGEGSGTILDDTIMIDADRYTPVDDKLIPTGVLAPVEGTPLDFRKAQAVGSRIKDVGGDPVGYDHNFVLNGSGLRVAAVVEDPTSGRRLTVSTDQPGIQFYSGNFLDGKLVGKGGHAYPQYGALCLEPQHFPDSIHHDNFPSVVLKPGAPYHSTIIYAFSTASP